MAQQVKCPPLQRNSSSLTSLVLHTKNIFIASEAPYYPTGFGIITGSVILGGVAPISAYWYFLSRENKRRDQMDVQQIKDSYSEEELAKMGEHSPLFRYVT